MNRQQRRKAARGHVHVAGGVVESTGGYDQGATGNLPDKVPGRHRWILLASYVITEQQVANQEAAERGESFSPSYLDHETRFALVVGCFDCERRWPDIRAGSTCLVGDCEPRP